MSTHVVGKKTIDRVVTCVGHSEHFPSRPAMREIQRKAQRNPDKFGQDLWELNEQAFNTLYKKDKGVMPEYTWEYAPESIMQQYKTVAYFVYQCSEGPIVDTELYQAMAEWENYLAETIVESLPEYQAAEWR